MYRNKRSCLIYVRKAKTEKYAGIISLAQQERKCRKYAREKGVIVRRVIHDRGISGNQITRRGLFLLVKCLERLYNVEYLIVADFTRLGRKSNSIVRKMIEFASPGITVVAVDLGPERPDTYLDFTNLSIK
ncbi:MAG: recombinase family protein [Candidatus Shapirobacteria bacterium]